LVSVDNPAGVKKDSRVDAKDGVAIYFHTMIPRNKRKTKNPIISKHPIMKSTNILVFVKNLFIVGGGDGIYSIHIGYLRA
jgi:hypothetical protein